MKQFIGLTEDEVLDIGVEFANLGGEICEWYDFYKALEARLIELNIKEVNHD
jgi:hypothetical protein